MYLWTSNFTCALCCFLAKLFLLKLSVLHDTWLWVISEKQFIVKLFCSTWNPICAPPFTFLCVSIVWFNVFKNFCNMHTLRFMIMHWLMLVGTEAEKLAGCSTLRPIDELVRKIKKRQKVFINWLGLGLVWVWG